MQIVYFIECAGRIKIGTTKNLKARLASIRTSAPAEANVIATIPGGREVERRLHESLAAHRIKLEWFNDCPPVRLAIDAEVSRMGGGYSAHDAVRPVAGVPTAPQSRILHPAQRLDGPASEKLVATIEAVTNRFTALIHSEAAQDGRRVNDLEYKLGLPPGSLMRRLYACDTPFEAHQSAVAALKRLSWKFTKVTDRASLAVAYGDMTSANALCRASEVLIERAEAAFAALMHTSPSAAAI